MREISCRFILHSHHALIPMHNVLFLACLLWGMEGMVPDEMDEIMVNESTFYFSLPFPSSL